MLDPNQSREERLLLPIVTSPAVSGRVLVLGHSPFAVSAFVNNPSVTHVFYCPEEGSDMGSIAFSGRAAMAKLTVAGPSLRPQTLTRRDIGVDAVDFLFCDMSRQPWQRGREQQIKARARTFRPRTVSYRYQELDVAAQWVASGCNLNKINRRAFAVFAAETGILISPDTDQYARRCASLAREFMGKVR